MPATRIRSSQDSALLNVEDNPAERKRVLNVLAQRRYRDRKRARLASLEDQAQKSNRGGNTVTSDQNPQQPNAHPIGAQHYPQASSNPLAGFPVEGEMQTEFSLSLDNRLEFGFLSSDELAAFSSPVAAFQQLESPPNNQMISDRPVSEENFTPNSASGPQDIVYSSANTARASPMKTFHGIEALPNNQSSAGLPVISDNGTAVAASVPQVEVYSSADTAEASRSFRENSFDRSKSLYCFPNETKITTPCLSLIRAHSMILQRIRNSTSSTSVDLWDLSSISPFVKQSISLPALDYPPLDLPQNYHPTVTQKHLPHHPLLDLFPWPSVRDKIMHVLSSPIEFRPANARTEAEQVIMQLIFDMKDSGGGLRVWGSNPFDPANWEVGQRFFERWWWAFDMDIVKKSNEWRIWRGESVLRLKK